MKKLLFLFLLLFISNFYAQEINITDQLKAVESGNIQKAQNDLKKMKNQNPEDPSVLFLDAVLTENGKTALTKYSSIINNFPNSRYADAALFRIYSYYFAAGLYNTAQKYLDQLMESYPDSPYLKSVRNKNPDDIQFIKEEKETETLESDLTEVEPAKTDLPKADKVYKYTIQAGAFLVLNNANNLFKVFENAGYYSEIKEKKIGGSTFNVVFVGRFETESEAKSFLNDLNKRHSLNGRIVSIE